ncbi:glycosyltransferase family 39 protein [Opitutus sp. ER46]|uniref:glycosyltransferase family 39 protein n=1 Tax=Opitutus sp. ER46 TaxID=2161864 RepID=UPI000D2F583B|nr:glycosyltransferase family 39 protein [Opitutus sp. ER46]PTX95545.1 hypothetical protein DB354_08980 [Opitutus sp. ER46]
MSPERVAAPLPPPAPRARSAALVPLLVVLLLAAHFLLAVGSKRHESTTSDELVHLTGGYAYWEFNDYRLHPENGILPQRWAALPTYLQGATFPALEQDCWHTSDAWVLGHQFFYETGEDHFPRLLAARAMIALFSVATGLLVFVWSRRLFGSGGALLSLALFAFSPTFLAHGALATSDVCMGFFFLASVGAYWRHLHDGRWRWGAISALTFGLACVAKFSAVLLLPMLGLLALARLGSPAPLAFGARTFAGRGARLTALLASGFVHAATALLVIWTFYGFRYSAANPELPGLTQFIRRWELIAAAIGWQADVVGLLARLHALPEAFLYGYSYVIESAQTRSAFLNGEYSLTGWRLFFPWTFALKTTVPVLLAMGTAGIVVLGRWRRDSTRVRADLTRVLPLIVLFVVYWAFSLTSRLNIGHRHIIPTYPVLFIAAGAIVTGVRSWRMPLAWLALALGGAQAVEAARAYPHFLAYFNPLSGGPATAYRHLVDSSLDWGQDLPGLKAWLEQHRRPGEPWFLSYFGTGEPNYYGLHARRLVMINGFKIEQPLVALEPGIYAISATALQHVYSPLRGPWATAQENAYQRLRPLEPALLDYSQHPDRRPAWAAALPKLNWARVLDDFELLRFARLCHLLRARAPDAQIGHSILIYRLTATDIQAATGDFARWRAAIEAAVSERQDR